MYEIKVTDKSKFQVTSNTSITMKDAEFIDNLLSYKLPKNIRVMFIEILDYMGYWYLKREGLLPKKS